MEIQMLDLAEQYSSLKKELDIQIEKVLSSSSFILGENVSNLEKQIAEFSNCQYGIGVGNGSDAIHIALQAAGIKEGDEVITTPFTFFATGGSIARTGATPVFIDINPQTFNLDYSKLENAITDNTKAIIPVHLYGQMANMKEIMKIAEKYNLIVIEDAAQAIGASANGNAVGELSSAATYSFFPTKNLGAYGDGGMIVTNKEQINEKSKVIRVHGSKPKYHHHILGYNSRLDELQAAILNVKVYYLKEYNDARRDIAKYYTNKLNKKLSNFITTPHEDEGYFHVYHQYTLRVKDRDELQKYLKSHGIASTVYYPIPLHLQPVFSYLGYSKGDFPETERATAEVLSLPIWPEMKREQQDYIIEKVVSFYKNKFSNDI